MEKDDGSNSPQHPWSITVATYGVDYCFLAGAAHPITLPEVKRESATLLCCHLLQKPPLPGFCGGGRFQWGLMRFQQDILRSHQKLAPLPAHVCGGSSVGWHALQHSSAENRRILSYISITALKGWAPLLPIISHEKGMCNCSCDFKGAGIKVDWVPNDILNIKSIQYDKGTFGSLSDHWYC